MTLSLSAGFVLVVALAQVSFPAPAGKNPAVKAPAVAVRVAGASNSDLAVTRVEFGPVAVESVPLLAGIRLLPIDVAGRSPVYDFASAEAQVLPVGGGASCVQLPGAAAIRIFHYQRPAAKRFGLFAVRGAGEVQVLIERDGVDDAKDKTPFDRSLAAARDGRTFAVAAMDYSGGIDGLGDAWLIRADGSLLANGSIVRELTGAGEQDTVGNGFAFHGAFLYGVVDEKLARAPADGSAGFAPVALPSSGGVTPAMVHDEIVRSADGTALAFLAGGLNEVTFDVYLLDAAGAIRNVTQSPAAYQEPDFLPASDEGPHLALSANGSHVAYEIDFPAGNELFVRSTQPGAQAFHLTTDAAFDTSIDQLSGILTGGSFVRFLGASGQQNSDLYRASLPATPADPIPALKNLTQTSGAADPFFPNTATIQAKAQANLRGARVIVDDQTAAGAGFVLWHASALDVATEVLSNLSAQPSIVRPAISPTFGAIVARAGAQHYLLRYDATTSPLPILSLPSGIAIDAAAMKDGGHVTAIAADVAGQDHVALLSTLGPGIALVGGGPFAQARDLQFGRDGSLVFTAQTLGAAQTFAVSKSSLDASPAGAPAPVAFWLR